MTFEQWFHKKNEYVIQLAYDILENYHDAEDVAIEVFMEISAIFQKCIRLLPEQCDEFLCAITRQHAYQMLQDNEERCVHEILTDQFEYIPTVNDDSFNTAISSASINELKTAILSLHPLYKKILTMHYLESMSITDIARQLGVPRRKAAQKLQRAKAFLIKQVTSCRKPVGDSERSTSYAE